MSQKQSTDTIERIDVSDSANGNPSKLAELARQAYQQRRTKDCLDLSRALLLIDPDNVEAQQMRSAIRAEIQQDLDNARTFIRQAQTRQNVEQVAVETVNATVNEDDASTPQSGSVSSDGTSVISIMRSRRVRWIVAAGIVAASLVIFSVIRIRPGANSVEASVPAPVASRHPDSIVSESAAPTGQPTENNPVSVQTSAGTTPVSLIRSLPVSVAPVARASSSVVNPDSSTVQPAAAGATGFLAVSSLTSVEIYENGTYLGSTPVSLELNSGAHTLEYHHGNLRKTLTHMINGNETTKASIVFEVTVQVNSKPWARVFAEGTERKELGQTPMSSISVPIGAVLTFENPQFQAKKYRVTGNESGIQIVFP